MKLAELQGEQFAAASEISPRAVGVVCVECGARYEHSPRYLCDSCDGLLEVCYAFERTDGTPVDYLPLTDMSPLLGEGGTPLVRAPRLASRLGISELLLKCESSNPTGSFKDRPAAMGLRMAKHFGYRRVIVASSGNGAAATAAMAARSGVEAVVLVPASTPAEKVRQAASYGARIVAVEGPYSQSYRAARELAEQLGAYNVTTTFLNPYTVEADKTVGYEIADALEHTPDYIYVPIGAGPLLVGIRRGITERGGRGVHGAPPRMVGVQARGVNPVVAAFRSGEPVQSVARPDTIAGGIADGLVGYTGDGEHTLRHIRQSGGHAADADDDRILAAQRWLAEDEGLFVEPSSAAGIAALAADLETGTVPPGAHALAVLTGHGLKDMSVLRPADMRRLDGSPDSIADLINELRK